MGTAVVIAAVEAEAAALAGALDGLAPAAWERPTRCVPWRVHDLVGHVVTVLGRVPEMVASPAPAATDTDAVGYYRADERFSEAANADRVRTARLRAAVPPAALVDELARTAREVIAAGRRERADRVVRTRHGDAMLLREFLATRVVELSVHGLDVADAVDRQPWLTGPAAECVQELLFGPGRLSAVAGLGWDPVTLLRKTTGRAPVTASESAELARLGLRDLTLG